MIQITRVEHLLHCVVPAATVRMQVEAAGIGERAVPAEIAALETALQLITQAGFVVHTPRWQRGPSLIQDAKQILTQMIDSKRRGDAIGGNDEAQGMHRERAPKRD